VGLEVRSTGSGEPVTVVAHGLGGSIEETRPLVGGVPGTRVLYSARGHGASPSPDAGFSYDLLARDLLEVAGGCGATQAFGVSLGASTLLAALAGVPDRFDRVVLFLPAVLDQPRSDAAAARVVDLAAAVDAGDAVAVRAAVARELPAGLGGPGQAYVEARSRRLLERPTVAAVLRAVPGMVPLTDRSVLGAVSADVLVLAQEGDPLHPVSAAREVAAALPKARLVVFDAPGVVFRERARLRALVTGHLAGPAG
jgi:3-oxoadipate enol-lactonase